jgi:hypothetical protein
MEEFEAYLTSKKINAEAFRQHEPRVWEEWSRLFAEVHPNNFTQQKLFLINPIRRKYPLKEDTAVEKPKPAKVKPKFKIPPRPKK